jgi:hypothetical protein
MIEGGQAWLPPPMLAADLAAGEVLLHNTEHNMLQ